MAGFPSFKKTITMLLCSAALAGCSGSSDPMPSGKTTAAPPPGDVIVVNKGVGPAQTPLPQDESTVLAPAALKPDETTMIQSPPLQEGVPQPLEMPQTIATTTVPEPVTEIAKAPASETDRIAVLEKEVAALRADYNSMMPAFNGLITTNERIHELLKQLEAQAGGKARAVNNLAVEPAKTKADVKAAVEEPSVKIEPAAGAPVISGLRVGEHEDKTRLVLDVSEITEYRTDVDNAGKVLVITLPEAGWSGKGGADGLRSSLVQGWTAQPGAQGGSTVSVRLKKDARIVATERLKASGEGPARIVIDIAAGASS